MLRCALPQACVLCAAASGPALLCNACIGALPRIAHACSRCALPVREGSACSECADRAPPWAATIAAWRYAFPADQLLQSLKYGGQFALADAFADALVAAVIDRPTPWPDRIVAVPLAASRQRERGFNHAQEIARRVASRTGVRLLEGLGRIRDTPPQAGLDRATRARNVRGAFAFSGRLDGLVIALVDDVMTTGATLAAASQALTGAGAARVDAWVIARTLLS
jgi:ComF family protein